MENGLCEVHDYGVDFQRMTIDLFDLVTGEIVGRRMADVPMRMRRA
ncbi:hypothetical protein IID24_04085 [Patescibacteria group bacterium]|nr:hypothetical protein [Patescibacteria group bacterium]